MTRKAAREDGKQGRKDGYDKLIDGSFSDPKENVQKSLNEFVRHSNQRGIERFTSKPHYKERKEERLNAIRAVLLGQTQAHLKGLPADQKAQQLREVSLVFCLNAKVFARRMGKADEAAAYPKTKEDRRARHITGIFSHTATARTEAGVLRLSRAA